MRRTFNKVKISRNDGSTIHIIRIATMTDPHDGKLLVNLGIICHWESATRNINNATSLGPSNSLIKRLVNRGTVTWVDNGNVLSPYSDDCNKCNDD